VVSFTSLLFYPSCRRLCRLFDNVVPVCLRCVDVGDTADVSEVPDAFISAYRHTDSEDPKVTLMYKSTSTTSVLDIYMS
jgi:hypothetical protein